MPTFALKSRSVFSIEIRTCQPVGRLECDATPAAHVGDLRHLCRATRTPRIHKDLLGLSVVRNEDLPPNRVW